MNYVHVIDVDWDAVWDEFDTWWEVEVFHRTKRWRRGTPPNVTPTQEEERRKYQELTLKHARSHTFKEQ